MSETPYETEHAIFSREFERRIDDLIAWAVTSSPKRTSPLFTHDFAKVRESMCEIARGGGDALHRELEPAEGGPQYVNDNPAPWP
jgi:hypothetical protein